jgi:hypothetical protein
MFSLLSYYSVFPSFLRVIRLLGTRVAAGGPSSRLFFLRRESAMVQCKGIAAGGADTNKYGKENDIPQLGTFQLFTRPGWYELISLQQSSITL